MKTKICDRGKGNEKKQKKNAISKLTVDRLMLQQFDDRCTFSGLGGLEFLVEDLLSVVEDELYNWLLDPHLLKRYITIAGGHLHFLGARPNEKRVNQPSLWGIISRSTNASEERISFIINNHQLSSIIIPWMLWVLLWVPCGPLTYLWYNQLYDSHTELCREWIIRVWNESKTSARLTGVDSEPTPGQDCEHACWFGDWGLLNVPSVWWGIPEF